MILSVSDNVYDDDDDDDDDYDDDDDDDDACDGDGDDGIFIAIVSYLIMVSSTVTAFVSEDSEESTDDRMVTDLELTRD